MPTKCRSREDRPGFTLIELLVVVVVIAVLATIGVMSYWSVREKSLQTTVRSDLHTLIKHQELYYLAHGTYAAVDAIEDYSVSPGVQIRVGYAQPDGWSGSAVHNGLPSFACGFYVGVASPPSDVPASGQESVTCTGDP